MSSWGDYTKPETKSDTEGEVYREKIEYEPLKDEPLGLNIAICGEQMHGKSCLASMFGYFNSYYLKYMDKEKYPNTVRLLKEGFMPEVEEIKVLDLDNSYKKNSSRGFFRDLVKPFKSKGIISVETIDMPSRQQKVKNGKIVNDRVEELFRCKKMIEDAIEIACEDYGPETLFIIDSISSYYETLDDVFSLVYEYIKDVEMFSAISNQKDWKIRNSWWRTSMKKKRNYPGWQIDTVKIVEKPDHWKRDGQSNYTFKWAEGGGDNYFNLDQVYWIMKDVEGNAYFNLVDGRYKSPIETENIEVYYPTFSQEAAISIIEHMAPYIMEGQLEEIWM